VLREQLADGEDTRLVRALIDGALGGDRVALRFLVERLLPKPRGREIELSLTDDAMTHEQIFDAALQKMAAGEVTPEEAALIGKLLIDRRAKFGAAGAPARPAAPADSAESPAFDLQIAGHGAPPPANRPLNRHERRRAAALQRAAAWRDHPPPAAAAA
jgi:hypothetical protein